MWFCFWGGDKGTCEQDRLFRGHPCSQAGHWGALEDAALPPGSTDFTCSHPFSFHPSLSIPLGFSPAPFCSFPPLLPPASSLPYSCLSIPVFHFSVLVLLCLHKSSCPTQCCPKHQGPARLPSSCADSGRIPGSPLLLSALHNVSGALGINKDFRVCQLQ